MSASLNCDIKPRGDAPLMWLERLRQDARLGKTLRPRTDDNAIEHPARKSSASKVFLARKMHWPRLRLQVRHQVVADEKASNQQNISGMRSAYSRGSEDCRSSALSTLRKNWTSEIVWGLKLRPKRTISLRCPNLRSLRPLSCPTP